MIKQKISEALALYAGASLWVAYYNLAISLQLRNQGYDDLSEFLRTIYRNHLEQSEDIYDYMTDQGSIPQIRDIVELPQKFGTVEEALERSLIQTVRLTDTLESLMDILIDAKDHTTYASIQYLLTQQFKEEVAISKKIEKLKRKI